MDTICFKKKCINCCRETQMPLSISDIKRIEQIGFKQELFVYSNEGWVQLKNKNGLCVFHTGEKCSIYEHRPEGCTLYPVIFDYDTKQAILDDECPYRTTFSITRHIRTQLSKLVSNIILERNKRLR
jgi:Fe-S-cluster containining protein